MSLFGSSHGKSSLFGGGDSSKKVSPPHKFDWGAAALSFMGVDPNLFIGRRRAQAAAAAEQQVRDGLKARGYADSDIDVLMSDPKAASQLMSQLLQPRTLAPNDEIATPGMDPTHPRIYHAPAAPSELQRQAEYLESIGRKDLADALRAKAATTVVQGTDAATGQPIVQGLDPRQLFPGGPPAGAPMMGQPPRAPRQPGTLTDDDIRRMEQGGAGSQAPRPFPGF